MNREIKSWLYEAALAALVLLVVVAAASGADPLAPTRACQATVVSVHDGDSLIASVNLGFGVMLAPRPWRAFDFDCYEIDHTRKTVGPISDDEIAKGKAARDDLLKLLAVPGTTLWFEDPGKDGGQTYDRTVSTWWVRTAKGEWIYVARWMREKGHIRTPREP